MSHPFEKIYDEHVWSVYAFFSYRLGTREDAEDLTQLTFERALKSLSRYDPSRGSHKTWLMAIASNVLIDSGRRTKVRPFDATDPSKLAELGLAREEPDYGIGADLESALASLGQREREVLALRYGADLTGPEIAELTGLSLSNVQQITSRALRRLRETMADS